MSYTTVVEHDAVTDEYYLVLPDGLLAELGWVVGTEVAWTLRDDGSVLLSRVSDSGGA